MEQKTTGKVISASKLWFIKKNTKAVRTHALDGAEFPHMIKLEYTVNAVKYTKRKYIKAGLECPQISEEIPIFYDSDNHAKCRIELG